MALCIVAHDSVKIFQRKKQREEGILVIICLENYLSWNQRTQK